MYKRKVINQNGFLITSLKTFKTKSNACTTEKNN